MAKLSVVIPVFNRADCVKIMVESIISQSFKDWELYLVDDGSDQETVSVLKTFAANDQRINYVVRDRLPKGAQRCRNMGFELSKGEFVLFLDSDDYLPEFCFEKRIEYMMGHPELDYAVFPYVSYNETPGDNPFLMCGGVPVDEKDLCHFLFGSIPYVVWNNIYRRSSLITKGRSWDERILSLQDADYNIQNILSGLRYDYAFKDGFNPDYFFRIGGASSHISHYLMTSDHAESHLYFAEKTLNSLTQDWKRSHPKYVRWCLIHKFLLLRKTGERKWSSQLLEIAKKNNCYIHLNIQFSFYFFLVDFLKIKEKAAKNIAFFYYYHEFKQDRRRRKALVTRVLMN